MKLQHLLILILTTICISNNVHSMFRAKALMIATKRSFSTNKRTVKLPPELTIRDRLCRLDLAYYAEKSRICEKLGGKEFIPLGVSVTVTLSIHDYIKFTPEYFW